MVYHEILDCYEVLLLINCGSTLYTDSFVDRSHSLRDPVRTMVIVIKVLQ